MIEELKKIRLKAQYDDMFELFSDTTKASLFALFGFSATFMVGGFGLALSHMIS